MGADVPPLLYALVRRRSERRAAADRWEERIPAALTGWHVNLDPAGGEFVLYRRNPNLATLPTHSFYAALDDAWRIAAYYELLPVAELARFYARRLAFYPP